MKRNTLNLLIDAASAMVLAGLIATGLLVRFVLPPGSGSRRVLWDLGRHDWGDVHFWLAVSAGMLLLLHVAMHWQWVCTTVLRLCNVSSATRPWSRNAAGAGLVLLLVALFVALIVMARGQVKDLGTGISDPDRGYTTGGSPPAEDGGGVETIRGSMTLAEAAEAGAIPVTELKSRLGLPEALSNEEQLGRAGREHGFTMSRVRQVIYEYQRLSPSTARGPREH